MPGDCCSTADTAPPRRCPGCDTAGAPVDRTTVKGLLTDSALRRVTRHAHRFCATLNCPVVYFDTSGQSFHTDEVRVPVWQKQVVGDRIICYCFGENERDIRTEFGQCGSSDAVRRVREHIAKGRCACKTRNPRGMCCLGDLVAAVARIEASLRKTS